MVPFDHHSPSSVLDSPIWLLDSSSVNSDQLPLINTPPPPLQLDLLPHPTTLQQAASSLPTSRLPNQLLASSSPTSCMSSKGASSARVTKRKSRAKPKPPIKELSASPSNFRDIVHHFTGSHSTSISSSSSCNTECAMPISTQNGSAAHDLTSCLPMLRQSSGTLSQNDAVIASACIAQSLKTLEAISAYLLKPLYTTQVLHEQTGNDMNTDSEGNMTRGDRLNNSRNMHSIGLLDKSAIQRQAAELEQCLLKGNDKIDNFFSLSCLVLNQIASQCGILQGLR